jgi:hypothetical protein
MVGLAYRHIVFRSWRCVVWHGGSGRRRRSVGQSPTAHKHVFRLSSPDTRRTDPSRSAAREKTYQFPCRRVTPVYTSMRTFAAYLSTTMARLLFKRACTEAIRKPLTRSQGSPLRARVIARQYGVHSVLDCRSRVCVH